MIRSGWSGPSTSARSTLQDFNLDHTSRLGFRPSKVAYLAHHVWGSRRDGCPEDLHDDQRREYSPYDIKQWLGVFIRRFYASSQFKRPCLPNGPRSVPATAVAAQRLARADRCRSRHMAARVTRKRSRLVTEPPYVLRASGCVLSVFHTRPCRPAQPHSLRFLMLS